MIIFGSRSTQLAIENISGACSHCGQEDRTKMLAFQKYAHVFWIPFCPIGKKIVTQCFHCGLLIEKSQFSNPISKKHESLHLKTPFWTFTGLGLLVAFGIFMAIVGKQSDNENAKLVSAPERGDIYRIKKDYKRYTVLKVHHMVGDTAFLLESQYETNKISGLGSLLTKGDEGFYEELLPLLKSDLKDMLENGEIIDIHRNVH